MAIIGGRELQLLNALRYTCSGKGSSHRFVSESFAGPYEFADKTTSMYKQGNDVPERQIGRNASGDRVNVDGDRDGWFVYKRVDDSPGRSEDEVDRGNRENCQNAVRARRTLLRITQDTSTAGNRQPI